MIQDIAPKKFYNPIRFDTIAAKDKVVLFDERSVLIQRNDQNELIIPSFYELKEQKEEKFQYAFSIDQTRYFIKKAEYMQEKCRGLKDPGNRPVTVSGLASEGKILFPVQKDKEAVKVERELAKNRTNLIEAARNGDEEAMESLTMEDMDTYSMISQRIVTDDILTIVDSYFMPYGIECDQYNVLGEILDIMKFKNILTGEEICQMTIESNDMQFDVCINSKDLLGEPAVGRRFKGTIWLQGKLHY